MDKNMAFYGGHAAVELYTPPRPKWWKRHWKLLLVIIFVIIAAVATGIGASIALKASKGSVPLCAFVASDPVKSFQH